MAIRTVHTQVEGSAVNVGFEWGNDGSLHVDATSDAAANGAPQAENNSPVQYSQKVSAPPNHLAGHPSSCERLRLFPHLLSCLLCPLVWQ